MTEILKKNKLYFTIYAFILLSMLVVAILTDKGSGVIMFDTYRQRPLDIFFMAATKIGEYYTYLVFIFFFLFIRKSYRSALSIAVMGTLLPLISYMLKMYFKHPRPLTYFSKYIDYKDFHGIENLHYHTGHNSFPSGHTFAAFALFTFLALRSKNKAYGILYLSIALLVGISRIYLSQHFIEDVAFGSILGVLYGTFTYYVFFISHNFRGLKFVSKK